MIQIFINDKKYVLADDQRITGRHIRGLAFMDDTWDVYLKRGRGRERLIQDHMEIVPRPGDRFYTRVARA